MMEKNLFCGPELAGEADLLDGPLTGDLERL